METYGFDKLSVRKLTTALEPDTTSGNSQFLEGKQKEGGPTALRLNRTIQRSGESICW
ncbi:MAG: hypothetical protein ACLSIL_13135 [Enterococcus casseliflavus]